MSDWTVIEVRTWMPIIKRISMKKLAEEFFYSKGFNSANVSVDDNEVVQNTTLINNTRIAIPNTGDKLCKSIFDFSKVLYNRGIKSSFNVNITF